ncbi:amino acid adenylation domain-containing protein [Bryocella elongata]|uniref:Amino acid adenylation domain-containing protein n=1 Tax=Bryocella elongata TaxID=863522 RepID=A0A1H6AWH2_9BACT|nr:amino acid adenylation domain-containing protein [Bryocella elongata]SEG52654.1 amino acid adenylation domain-containing protein [Bryocella elongata]
MIATTNHPMTTALEAPFGSGTVPTGTLWEQFARVAHQQQDKTAVTFDGASTSYRSLAMQAEAVAYSLLRHEAGPEAIVAILTERTPAMVAAMLGVIRAGAAYLPLDPKTPALRVRDILHDAKPVAIITDRAHAALLSDLELPVLVIEDLPAAPAHASAPPYAATLDSLAYVIYTSGSTGTPKGVMVTQNNVSRLFTATRHWFQFNEHDVWTMFHSFAFDFSVWEMWGPLLTGGRMVIVPFATSRSPEEFYDLLARENVTVLNQTPTAFTQLIHAEERAASLGRTRSLALRLVIFGGEALNLRALAPWVRRHSDARPELINMYGITETAVHVTRRRVLEKDIAQETESLIGEPIPDLTLDLLNASLQPVATGEIGEIFVGGAGVARGYLNRAELTAERFIESPFVPNGMLYRSGDLARRRDDGELVYMGRADRQVKINGFRIELGEIEAVLASHQNIAQATVLPFESEGRASLAACVVARAQEANESELRRFMEQRLPAHMRPDRYAWLPLLPMNVNGKVDREPLLAALRAQRASARVSSTTPITHAPKSQLESTLAAAWCRVLGLERVGLNENFFDSGASSLKLAALRTELERALERSIPMAWLFEHATIRSLAARLEREGLPESLNTTGGQQDRARLQREALARLRSNRTSPSETEAAR